MPDIVCDVLVVGSGAAGLSAAVTAAWHGLRVVVAEKDPVFGGATAWSGGWMWVPGNPLARRAGIDEDPSQPRTYLRNALRDRYDAARIDAFLDHCPHMVAFFEANTDLQFVDGNSIPDMHAQVPGAATQGHQVTAAPYDGRKVGPLIHRLRKTMRETSLSGMPIMAGADLGAFLTATRSLKSLRHVAQRLSRHACDLAIHGRAMHLVNGVALVARLATSAEKLAVTLMESSPVVRLVVEEGVVRGAVLSTAAGERMVRAERGVVLAAGGFPNDIERRKALLPRAPTEMELLALPPTSCSGDGVRLGESVGGCFTTDLASPFAWAPVSKVTFPDGTVGHFPHIADRGKPGVIGVLANGKRFANEADGYFDYTVAMIEAAPAGEVASWLICDHRFQRRYGLGISKPFPLSVKPYLETGYLKRRATIEELARACAIAVDALRETLAMYNEDARRGEDRQFGRGSTPFNRKQGDPLHHPNPCVAPIEHPPFYAVKVQPGCFGTFAGLKTNEHAQVVDRSGEPIPGLYAAGADMASVMGGYYPSGGINLGPAMTFGYIAGRHIAGVRDGSGHDGALRSCASAISVACSAPSRR
jgi:succinate dehydrogenase/fumarate reductase flavoprotein subunit